jgi:hypothetical protein
MGYDHDDLSLAAYDWRLAYYNLEVRDKYFSRLKAAVEFNLKVNGKKTVLVSHSMGGTVVLVRLSLRLTWTKRDGAADFRPSCFSSVTQWFMKSVPSFLSFVHPY